ncbi:MAG: N-6 DNA methylase [Candidatus Latescibacterota bacterium]
MKEAALGRARYTASRRSPASLAQHFTPPAVADFVWALLRLYSGGRLGPASRVIDPAAGRGALLEAVLREGLLAPREVYGIEIDPLLTAETAAALQPARLLTGDGLTGALPGVEPASFDAVVANPPFGRPGTILPPQTLARAASRLAVWRAAPGNRRGAAAGLAACPVEVLFVERALELVVPGGVVGLIMPEGFYTNARLQWARDWVLGRARVLVVAALPAGVFRRGDLCARAGVLVLQRPPGGPVEARSLLLRPTGDDEEAAGYLQRAQRMVRRHVAGGRPGGPRACLLSARRLAGQRWDASFWRGRMLVRRLARSRDVRPLGDFIELLAYGPIITGSRPTPVAAGVRVVRQSDFAEAGLRRCGALYVEPGSPHDPPRTRVRPGDLLLPRSGAGSLGRNRMAVMVAEELANVSCFVDLIRLCGIDPFYVWLFLRSAAGWGQIRSLLNGVGTPNISFAEIRSLRVPVVPSEQQAGFRQRYVAEVWPLHCLSPQSPAQEARAAARFGLLVRQVEELLSGTPGTRSACPSPGRSLHS